jgi:hypothetical protein
MMAVNKSRRPAWTRRGFWPRRPAHAGNGPVVTRFRLGAVAALVAVVALTVTTISMHHSSPQASTVPPVPAAADCREAPMAHVHDPARFTVLADCVAVSGTLTSARLEAAFLDEKAAVSLDSTYERFLRPENHGRLIVDVIPTDIGTVVLPANGTHATFYGAWVLNRATKAIELHPAWKVVMAPTAKKQASGSSGGDNAQKLHAQQKLLVSARAPKAVKVGDALVIKVAAAWQGKGKSQPASQVRMFLEMTDHNGKGVRWKAFRTNTLGNASIKLVTIQVPGSYLTTIYPITEGASGPVKVAMTVKRR